MSLMRSECESTYEKGNFFENFLSQVGKREKGGAAESIHRSQSDLVMQQHEEREIERERE